MNLQELDKISEKAPCKCHCHQEFHDSAFPSMCCKVARDNGIQCLHCRTECEHLWIGKTWLTAEEWCINDGAAYKRRELETVICQKCLVEKNL